LHLKCGQAPCTLSASVGPASQTELSAKCALALCVLWPKMDTGQPVLMLYPPPKNWLFPGQKYEKIQWKMVVSALKFVGKFEA